MPRNATKDNHLPSTPARESQEAGWEVLGVPLRPSMKRDVERLAGKMGLRPGQWGRLQIVDAITRAKAA